MILLLSRNSSPGDECEAPYLFPTETSWNATADVTARLFLSETFGAQHVPEEALLPSLKSLDHKRESFVE